MKKRLKREDYTAGWVCPLEVEQIAALQMINEYRDHLPQPASDHNIYNIGSIAGHNVVIAGLPQAPTLVRKPGSLMAILGQKSTTTPLQIRCEVAMVSSMIS